MKQILILLIAATAFLSCGTTKKSGAVPYTVAHGYFVRNDATPHAPSYYESQEAFDSVFGAATVMGKDGQPTSIDFSRQSVIALIGAPTIRPTEYAPLSLTAQGDTLHLRYHAQADDPTTYTMTPLLLLVVDKPHAKPHIKMEQQ